MCCILYNPRAVLRHLSIIKVLAAFIGNIVFVGTVTPQNERQQSVNRVSSPRQPSVNRVSTLLGVAPCIFQGLCYGICLKSTYWQPFCANAIVTWSQHLSENERQQSVNDFVCCILYNSRAVLRHLSIIEVLAAFIGNIVFVDTVTPQNECQQSVNNFVCCILYNPRAVLQHLPIFEVLAAFIGNMVCVNAATPQASMEPP